MGKLDTLTQSPSTSSWKKLFGLAAITSAIQLVCTFITIGVVLAFGAEPTSAEEHYAIMLDNPVIGVLRQDISSVINVLLFFVSGLAIYVVLREQNRVFSLLGTVFAYMGVMFGIATHSAFSMLYLSDRYLSASSDAQRQQLVTVGDAILTMNWWNSTSGFMAGLFMQGGLLILSILMLRSKKFSRWTAIAGIMANGFDLVHHLIAVFNEDLGNMIMIIGGPAYFFWYPLLAWNFYRIYQQMKEDEFQMNISLESSRLYKIGALATVIQIICLVLATIIGFMVDLNIDSALGFYESMQENRLMGILRFDLPSILLVVISIFTVLAIYSKLVGYDPAHSTLGVILSIVGVVLVVSSNAAISMFRLSDRYIAAGTDSLRQEIITLGEVSLAMDWWQSSAGFFGAVCMLGGITILHVIMLREKNFHRVTAIAGIVAGGGDLIHEIIELVAYDIGQIFLYIAGIGYLVWFPMLARDLFRLSKQPIEENVYKEQDWSKMYLVGAVTAIIQILGMFLTMIIGIGYGPDYKSATQFLSAMEENPVIGILRLDLGSMIMVMLFPIIGIAMYTAIKKQNMPYATIGVISVIIGVVFCFAHHSAFSMAYLYEHYSANHSRFLIIGEAILATNWWNSTSGFFGAVFMQGGIVVLSIIMLKSNNFSKITAYSGILSNGLDMLHHLVEFFSKELGDLMIMIAGPFYLIWYPMLAWNMYKLSKNNNMLE